MDPAHIGATRKHPINILLSCQNKINILLSRQNELGRIVLLREKTLSTQQRVAPDLRLFNIGYIILVSIKMPL